MMRSKSLGCFRVEPWDLRGRDFDAMDDRIKGIELGVPFLSARFDYSRKGLQSIRCYCQLGMCLETVVGSNSTLVTFSFYFFTFISILLSLILCLKRKKLGILRSFYTNSS